MADFIVEQVMQSIAARRARPVQERWDELVKRGAIDENGKVLLGTREEPSGSEAPPKQRGEAE